MLLVDGDMIVVADADNADCARASAERTSPAVALVELRIPDIATGPALVRALAVRPGCAVAAMSLRGGLEKAAVGAGAVISSTRATTP